MKSRPCFKRFLQVLAAALILSGCNEEESLLLFVSDMQNFVEVEFLVTSSIEDPCLLANGRAAGEWYRSLKAQHRETFKQNVQRYVRAVKFVKTEIVSGVPTAMARTQVQYDHGILFITTKGVLENNRVVCAPDIDVLKDFTAHKLVAATPASSSL